MPVFISYSHEDSEFADNLARQLVAHKQYVWYDKWELRVGDSLIEKIQTAVDGSSALLVLLSKSSVASEWCKKELNSGLLRELEEKRVVVMPVLIEDCQIPVFVRGKLYADFRHNFDDGLRSLIEGISAVTSDVLGRIDEPEFHVDWAVDWGEMEGRGFVLRLTLIEQAIEQPYCCLTEVVIGPDPRGLSKFRKISRAEGDEFARLDIIRTLLDAIGEGQEIRPKITNQMPWRTAFELFDAASSASYSVEITARRLGEDTGRDILLDIEGQLSTIRARVERALTTGNGSE